MYDYTHVCALLHDNLIIDFLFESLINVISSLYHAVSPL